MIIPYNQPLTGRRNGVFQWAGTIRQNGSPINLTDWIGRIQFRSEPGALGSPYITLATNLSPTPAGSSFTFSTPETGQFLVQIEIDDWDGFPEAIAPAPTFSAYDMVLTDPGGNRNPYVEGVLTLGYGVTRS